LKNIALEVKYKGFFHGFCLKDKYIKNYGSQEDLLRSHGISYNIILKKILKTIR
jgi:hypothetical protein